MDTILLSIEYYGNFWRKETYFCGIVYHDRVNTFSLFIDISEEKKDIQKKKRVVLKKRREYYRAAMTANSEGMFAAPRPSALCVNITGLCNFLTQFFFRISVNGRHKLNRCWLTKLSGP